MTKKLYDDNAYATDFVAQVVSCRERDGVWEVVLDQTLFFPEEGGQTPDKGEVAGFEVLDVQIKDGIITHTVADGGCDGNLASEVFATGCEVTGRIDWQHRFSNMQQHTGEHIFSGLVHSTYGYDNVGFHLSDNIVTMDYNGVLTAEQVRELEIRANQAIFENHPIRTEYPDPEALEKMDYRCKKELQPPIRIVTIEDVDVCACCAPHVKSTAEVGILKVIDVTKYKGGVRLSILCGGRALAAFQNAYDTCTEISHLTSQPIEKIVDAVRSLQTEIGEQKQKINESAALLLAQKIQEAEAGKSPEDAVILFTENCDMRTIRNAVNDLMERHQNYCGIFNQTADDTYAYLIGSHAKDCRPLATHLNEALSGKGGGKPEMIQGSITAKQEEIKKFLEGIRNE